MTTKTKEAKPTKKIPMQVCSQCGESVPANQIFRHWSDKHPQYAQEMRRRGGQHKAKAAEGAPDNAPNPSPEDAPEDAPKNTAENGGGKTEHTETKKSETKEEQQVKGRFITKVVDLPGDILVLYWLAKAAFPDYEATEGEWIADCVRQFYAEHSEELGLDKLLDKTYETIPLGVPTGAEIEPNGVGVLQTEKSV